MQDLSPKQFPARASFGGKVFVVTGASSGLGLALAKRLASEGAQLVLVGRDETKLKIAAASLGAPDDRFLCVAGDVSQARSAEAVVKQTVDRFGAVHSLVLCAGRGVLGPFAEVPWEEARAVLETNLHGPIHFVRAAHSELRKHKNSQIVFISSILGLRGFPRSTIYSASKFAVMGLAESLRLEYQKDGIHVLAVCPGRIDTPFLDTAKSVDGKKGLRVESAVSADRAADVIVKAMRARKRVVIFPFQVCVLHWINLWFPRLADRLILKRFQSEGLL